MIEKNSPVQGLILLLVLFLLFKYVNRTDVPKIKGLPEIPGIPMFGNLLQLGNEHAKRAKELAKKYGPVFQVRLGNKVNALAIEWSEDGKRHTELTRALNRE